jgi:hypothetical protein
MSMEEEYNRLIVGKELADLRGNALRLVKALKGIRDTLTDIHTKVKNGSHFTAADLQEVETAQSDLETKIGNI